MRDTWKACRLVAGVLAAIIGHQIGAGTGISLALAVSSCVVTIGLLAVLQYRLVIRPRGLEPSFPEPQREPSGRNR